jgi:hypothetical protein
MAIKKNKYFVGERVVIPARGDDREAESKKGLIKNLNYVSMRNKFNYEIDNGDTLFSTRNVLEDVLDFHNHR